MVLNLPNLLTWIRIVAIPLIVVVFFLPVDWSGPAAGILFALAGITDLLDGYLARKMGQTSRFGAFLDPVADKLVVATALVLIVQRDPAIDLPVAALTADQIDVEPGEQAARRAFGTPEDADPPSVIDKGVAHLRS